MMFNMGATKFTKEKWTKFYEAVNHHDWTTAAKESHRKDVHDKRNNWARDLFMKIKEKP